MKISEFVDAISDGDEDDKFVGRDGLNYCVFELGDDERAKFDFPAEAKTLVLSFPDAGGIDAWTFTTDEQLEIFRATREGIEPVLNDVAALLLAHGIKATVEYPGFLLIEGQRGSYAAGTANPTWFADYCRYPFDPGTQPSQSFDLKIRSTSRDWLEIGHALMDIVKGEAQ